MGNNMSEAKKKYEKPGQPTKYKDEHCQLVIELMSEGASKAEVCLELKCSFQTFLTWQEVHPEFLEAVKRGLHLSKGMWEKMGRKAAFGQVEGFNATAWIFNMKNRFGRMDEFQESWTDRKEIDNTSTDGSMSIDGLTTEERQNKIAALLAKKSV